MGLCVRSPTPSPTPAPTPSPTPDPTPSPTASPTPAPPPDPTPAPTPDPTPRCGNTTMAGFGAALLRGVGGGWRHNAFQLLRGVYEGGRGLEGRRRGVDLCVRSPTPSPTAAPTASPTAEPTPSPTPSPTPAPTTDPTPAPTPDPSPRCANATTTDIWVVRELRCFKAAVGKGAALHCLATCERQERGRHTRD